MCLRQGEDKKQSINKQHLTYLSLQAYLPTLEILNVSYNMISQLTNEFQGLPVLCSVDMSNNKIDYISPGLVTNTRCRNHGVAHNKLEILLQGEALNFLPLKDLFEFILFHPRRKSNLVQRVRFRVGRSDGIAAGKNPGSSPLHHPSRVHDEEGAQSVTATSTSASRRWPESCSATLGSSSCGPSSGALEPSSSKPAPSLDHQQRSTHYDTRFVGACSGESR